MNSDKRPADPQIGRVLGGQYRIEALLGQGGMGAVYRSVQLSVQRPVAIKLISASAPNQTDLITRFRREAEATARLSHPNTVRLFDFGVTDAHELFMVMELLEGSDLAARLTRGPLPLLEALQIVREVLQALSEAHALGIVHRDLKPGNVFLSRVHGGESFVKVMDFGIAGLEQTRDGQKLTITGAVMGTPAYMSPEQAQGKAVDARSDLYSIGVMLFEMLTGQPPFEANTLMSMLLAHVTQAPRRLRELGLDVPHQAGVQQLLDRLLAKQPADRPPSATQAIDHVERLIAQCEAGDAATTIAGAPGEVSERMLETQPPQPITPLGWDRPQSVLQPRAHGPWLAAVLIGMAAICLGLWLLLEPKKPQATGTVAPPQQPVATKNVAVDPRDVIIATTPSGARVLENEVELGRTPFRFAYQRDTTLQLRLAGYVSQRLQLTQDSEPTQAIALEREEKAETRALAEREAVQPAAEGGGVMQASEQTRSPAAALHGKRGRGRRGNVNREGSDDAPQPLTREETSDPPAQASANTESTAERTQRSRREELLTRAPPFPSIAAAQRAYSAGKINADAYEDAVWVLKKRRNERIEVEKNNLRQGTISAQEYEWRLGRIDAELRGE